MNTGGIRQIAEQIKASTRVVVLTGAGISQESGVPTFRGADGLWQNFRAEELATPEAFHRDPVLVWRWYEWRRGLIKPLKPNPGHYALVELEQRIEDFTLLTQNVDGLHRAAGSENPIEIVRPVEDCFDLMWSGLANPLMKRCCIRSTHAFKGLRLCSS